MWRSLFMAFGVMAIILGIETLLIEQASMFAAADSSATDFMDPNGAPAQTIKVWKPGERFPWAALAVGAVIILYAITLPKRFNHA